MNIKITRRAQLVFLAWLLLGCATPDRVILLPQADGSPSAIVVKSRQGGETVLSRPYAAAAVTRDSVETGVTNADEVQKRYKGLSATLPTRVKSFLVYFEPGGDRLTTESETRLTDILNELMKLPAPELMVIGHTDTVGSASANDKVSAQRAESIRARLIDKGVAAGQVVAIGRGKRDPLVATGDGVDEPRNRRVEIRLK